MNLAVLREEFFQPLRPSPIIGQYLRQAVDIASEVVANFKDRSDIMGHKEVKEITVESRVTQPIVVNLGNEGINVLDLLKAIVTIKQNQCSVVTCESRLVIKCGMGGCVDGHLEFLCAVFFDYIATPR
jgi:hypothetical protein